MSFERQVQILAAPPRPQEMEGTEGKLRESNKGQCRLIEERKKLALKLSKVFGCLGSFEANNPSCISLGTYISINAKYFRHVLWMSRPDYPG